MDTKFNLKQVVFFLKPIELKTDIFNLNTEKLIGFGECHSSGKVVKIHMDEHGKTTYDIQTYNLYGSSAEKHQEIPEKHIALDKEGVRKILIDIIKENQERILKKYESD